MKDRRSTNYREKYIAHYPPRCGKYMCVYCGRWVSESKMEVDHVFPIAKTDALWLKRILLRGNPNDLSNLVAACRRCNRRKGKKLGLWYIRGKFWHLTLHIYMLTLLYFRLSIFFALWEIYKAFIGFYSHYYFL